MMSPRWGCRLCFVSIVVALAASCLADVEPEVGALRAGTCKSADSDPTKEVSFTDDILPLLMRPAGEAGCFCHIPSSKRTPGLDATGLALDSYKDLIRGGNTSHSTIVIPGDPCSSLIVQKVGNAPPSGSRMPSDGPPYLTPTEIALLSDWIAEGAHDN
jgi:hypothetical protein